jgi:type IV pilus assembly protein PilA
MFVVAIIGVLAAIAIPAFISQMQRSRTTEAFSVIGEIKEAQAAYYATFSRYCGPLAWNPTDYANPSTQQAFSSSAPGWDDLGADSDGPVRFRYQVLAGPAGTTPAGILGFPLAEPWYVIHAQADLDGDGTTVVFEAYSASSSVYVSDRIGGSYLAQGWE